MAVALHTTVAPCGSAWILEVRSFFGGRKVADVSHFGRKASQCKPLVCRAKAPSMEEDEEDMMDLGLDDVFNLIEQASAADPEPEELTVKRSRSTRGSTAFSRWFKAYGRSFPASEDSRSKLYGPARPLWKGAATSPSDVPSYLKGQHPGDYGCDFLGLCKDPQQFARLRTSEVMHARWAMLGLVGCLYPELTAAGPAAAQEHVWFKALETFIPGLEVGGAYSSGSLAVLALLIGGAEILRARGSPGGGELLYPGGAFDPLGLSIDEETFAEQQVKELKNGRLAMLAMAGFFAQAAVTGDSPIKNLFH